MFVEFVFETRQAVENDASDSVRRGCDIDGSFERRHNDYLKR